MQPARILHLISRYNFLAVVVATLGAAWLWPSGALGVAVGGIFAGGNFAATCMLARRSFLPEQRRQVVYALGLAVKMVVALAVLAVLVHVLRLHPLAIATGLATLLIGIVLAGVHLSLVGFAHGE